MSEAVELTRELLRLRTINPPGDEGRCIEPLAARLEAAGFRCRRFDLAPGRPNLVARYDGAGGRPAVAFTGHLDTVPLGDAAWSRDPFAGEVLDGRIYGRGASDMKSGVAAIVVAACRHAASGSAGPVEIVLTSAEETGLEGAALLAGIEGSLGHAGALVVAEPTGNLPAFGNRGTVWLEITFEGRTAHASAPEHGINALLMAAEAAVKLAAHDLGGARHPVLGRPTVTVSRIQAGSNFNSVPDRAVLGLDLRPLPDAAIDAVIADLAGLAGPAATVREVVRCPGLWTDPGDPWLAGALDLVAGITGTTACQGAVPFNTDAAYLTPAYGEVPTLILGPGELAQAHQTDECCEIAKIDRAVEIYQELMRRGRPEGLPRQSVR